nr:hypothetical protein [Tanacetum cinerariifolium]
VCLKCDILSDDLIVDSGCTKHMNGNRRSFTSYKAYDGGHVVPESNLKGKVVGGGQLCDDDCVVSFTKVDCTISKNGKTLAKDNSMLWHRRLCHTNIRLVQNLASNEQVRNLPNLSFKSHFCDTCGLGSQVHLTKFDPKSYEGVFLGYSQTSKAYIVLNKEIMRIGESLNVTFDESLPDPKSSTSVEDDRINELLVQYLIRYPSLEANASKSGYPKSVKEAKGYPIKQVIGDLNKRTLRTYVKGMEVRQHHCSSEMKD